MEDIQKQDGHTSAAAFVEGGIQDADDDSCSICLEEFSSSDPSTVTNCKHEFHFQCILEWCQRSSRCPMCWQAVSLKDPLSQELLQGVERERTVRDTASRNNAIFHHPVLSDFELQHNIAAASATRRTRQNRREGQRRSSARSHPHFMVLSPDAQHSGSRSSTRAQIVGETEPPAITVARPSSDSSSANQEEAGPSEFQSFSESLKSRLNSFSSSTRGWTERLFSHNSSMSYIGNEVRREVNAGIASVTLMMQGLEINGNNRENQASASPHHSAESSSIGTSLT